jgi:hemoglobin
MAEYPTLFEWPGGRQSFDRMINALYDRIERDDLLSPFSPGGAHEDHRRHVAASWGEVFGVPPWYSDDLGGYERMLSKHMDLGITEEQRFWFATSMRLAADVAGMPDDPSSDPRWSPTSNGGTRIALGNSQHGAAVMEHASVPKWGWGRLRLSAWLRITRAHRPSRRRRPAPRP